MRQGGGEAPLLPFCRVITWKGVSKGEVVAARAGASI